MVALSENEGFISLGNLSLGNITLRTLTQILVMPTYFFLDGQNVHFLLYHQLTALQLCLCCNLP